MQRIGPMGLIETWVGEDGSFTGDRYDWGADYAFLDENHFAGCWGRLMPATISLIFNNSQFKAASAYQIWYLPYMRYNVEVIGP